MKFHEKDDTVKEHTYNLDALRRVYESSNVVNNIITLSSPVRICSISFCVTRPAFCKALTYALLPLISTSHKRWSYEMDALNFSNIGSAFPTKRPPHSLFPCLTQNNKHKHYGESSLVVSDRFGKPLTHTNNALNQADFHEMSDLYL